MIGANEKREEMVAHQITGRGIRDERVLDAMRRVPRELFVATAQQADAFNDTPLSIEAGQTISQPYIVALMAEALAPLPDDRVLEVGTGSGYGAAVLAELCGTLYTIERHAELALSARARLQELGYERVHVLEGDGTLGWPAEAPYDGIVVTAAAPSVPPALLDQLAIGGRLVIPVGETQRDQMLLRITRTSDGYRRDELTSVRFVPLIGQEGWARAS